MVDGFPYSTYNLCIMLPMIGTVPQRWTWVFPRHLCYQKEMWESTVTNPFSFFKRPQKILIYTDRNTSHLPKDVLIF